MTRTSFATVRTGLRLRGSGPPATRRKAPTLLTITPCPGCHAPAEVTERFTLPSTDGPVPHVAVSCAGGHHYRMAADRLPARVPGRPATPQPGTVPETVPAPGRA
jgi:hypothetical protein